MPRTEDWPLVTVAIPAYNAEATLARTLESILAQDYPNPDIVVSDNHSTDDTLRIVQSYANRGVCFCANQFKPVNRSTNEPWFIGSYDNCDNLLREARGDFVAFYHADDLYEPMTVSMQVAFPY